MKVIQPKSKSISGDRRLLLKDQAYVTLKDMILTGHFPPGTFLAERGLAIQLGMSKTPIKAALERLELEGFVTIAPQQCILVRELSPQEIAEQYEIRTALEGYVVRTLCGRLTEQQQALIQQQLRKQAIKLESTNIREQVEVDAEFHMLLAEVLGNQTIIRVMGELRDRVYRVITRVFTLSPDRFRTSYDEHCQIVKAIFENRPDVAMQLVASHLERGRMLDPARAS